MNEIFRRAKDLAKGKWILFQNMGWEIEEMEIGELIKMTIKNTMGSRRLKITVFPEDMIPTNFDVIERIDIPAGMKFEYEEHKTKRKWKLF